MSAVINPGTCRADSTTCLCDDHPNAPVILKREGVCHGRKWLQFFIITDARRVVVEMEPALWDGWKFVSTRIEEGPDSWGTYKRDSIVHFMMESNDGLTVKAEISTEFHAKLLAKAGL